MDKQTEETLGVLFRRAGLKLSDKDRKRFMPMLEAYLESVERLHSINLAGEEIAPVFRPSGSSEEG